jgi:teichuronic acid biosynthesis glycosyltransferase TuaG
MAVDRPRVSVVIPTYNHATMLREAIASVVAQTDPNWEAIVINNYSDDDTVDVVEEFSDPRVRLVNFRNNGVIAASRNKGIEQACGEWVAFLDSDDLWRADKLRLSLIAANDDVDLISHREATTRDGKVLSVSPHHLPKDATYRNLLFKGTCFSPSAALVRRSLLERVGGFSEDPDFITVEDYDLWLKLVQSGARILFIDGVLSNYRLHDHNASASVLRHMNAGLNAVGAHYETLKPKRLLDAFRLQNRRSVIMYGAGRSFQKSEQWIEARRCFAQSLMSFPLNLRALIAVFFTLFPKRKQTSNG